MFVDGYLTSFFSFSIGSIIRWINGLLTILSLVVVPYGFIKRKNRARLYALAFLFWSVFVALLYMMKTGEKIIGFLLFILYIIFVIYLLMSAVKRYFKESSMALVPVEEMKEYRYNEYILYSKLVRLKNEKLQVIYFFSKHKPKSGTPIALPYGYVVGVNKRSGLPYLKRSI
jgi:hypothetical protein